MADAFTTTRCHWIRTDDGLDILIPMCCGSAVNGPDAWRYTAAPQLADAGVDMRDIQAVTGHKTLSMVQKYTAQANQKAASRRAQTAREQSGNETGKY
ncbi:tyrosine-type recombinase/integrase [Rhodovulum sp. MB263]|uniref:tyrosine-type recombinase/integrase n=1 Tax=unclassified Rhodovulum TaxID=2631432 RepID=UPI001E435870|nr:tyrosine-type recombinase/integrase [Rhodovulum sp. MB263]